MAYDARTQNDLSKWWITGTGSTVNRLSEVMDDMPLGPAIYYMDADNAWTQNGATAEWYIAPTTEPDDVAENLSGWSTMTQVADDSETGDGAGLGADEWCWDNDNGRVYIRLSDDSDPNATDVRIHYAWDGSGAGPAIMTETVEDGIYLIHLAFEIGDGSTSTTLTSLREHVRADSGVPIETQSSATLTIGSVNDSWGRDGSFWYLSGVGAQNNTFFAEEGSTLQIYGSKIYDDHNGYCKIQGTTVDIKNSILEHSFDVDSSWRRRYYFNNITTFTLQDVIFTNGHSFNLQSIPDTAEDIHVHDCSSGVLGTAVSPISITDYKGTSNTLNAATYTAGTGVDFYLINPDATLNSSTVKNDGTGGGEEDSVIYEQYTINIHVVDESGANISGSIINLEGSDSSAYDTDMWTEDSVATAADGKITEQTVTVKKWVGTSETETDYNVFRYTIKAVGYETLQIPNITIDAAIDWDIELKSHRAPLDAWRD